MSSNYDKTNLSRDFQYVLEHYDEVGPRIDSSSEVYRHLYYELRSKIEKLVNNNDKYIVNASMGMTNKADCPWVAIMDRNITLTTQKGLYVAFLFKKDMSGFYLTLTQGMQNYQDLYKNKCYDNARKVADYFVTQIDDNTFLSNTIDLGTKKGTRGYAYSKGTIIEKYYRKDYYNDQILIADLKEIMSVYESITKHMDTASYDQVIKSVLASSDIHLKSADEAIDLIKKAIDPNDDMPYGFYRKIKEEKPKVERSEKFKRITHPQLGKIDYINKAKRDAEAGLLGEKLESAFKQI